MKQLSKLATLGAALTLSLGLGSAVMARAANEGVVVEVPYGPELEPVDSFSILSRPYSWQPIDEDTVIVWATAFDPYLVELAFPSHDLRFAEAIGLTSTGSRVYAKFDSLKVGGFRYPIDSIFKLSREDAKNWNRPS